MRQPGSPLGHAIDDDGRVLPPSLVHADTLRHIGFTTVLVKLRSLGSGNGQMLIQRALVLR